ncbi:MAG: glycosyltransferase family 2 protein [Miltoncostaeaceae bacterium]
MSNIAVSVVVPVYRGSPTAAELVERILAACADGSWDLAEIIMVDDRSPDDSLRVISDLAAVHPEVEVVALARNFGQHAALLAGMTRASGNVIVTMDDDLQHRPEEISVLLDALSSDVDLVYGQAVDEEHGWARNVTSRAGKRIIGVAANSSFVQHISGFRAFRAWLVPELLTQSAQHPSVDVPLLWSTDRVAVVHVQMDRRAHGTSNYSVGRLFRHALTMLLGYSTVPLRAVSYVGIGIGIAGAALLAYVLVNYWANGSTVPGFAFIGSMVALFAGVQLIAIGVIGEYLARLYAGAIGRPLFTIRASDEKGESDRLG